MQRFCFILTNFFNLYSKNEVNVGVERSDQQVEAAANASDEDESWSGPDA